MAKDLTEKKINPFDAGVTYPEFLSAIPKDKTVKEYCKDILTEDQIEWLENDLKNYKQHNKKEKE